MKIKPETTVVGYTNRNQQVYLGLDNPNGPDHGQSVLALRCERVLPNGNKCGFVYGVNATDIFHATCPKCRGGKENLPLVKHYT